MLQHESLFESENTLSPTNTRQKRWWNDRYEINKEDGKPLLKLFEVTRLLILDEAREELTGKMAFLLSSYGVKLKNAVGQKGFIEFRAEITDSTDGRFEIVHTWTERIDGVDLGRSIDCSTERLPVERAVKLPHNLATRFEKLHMARFRVQTRYFECSRS